jgi:hypothetical protein
MGGRHRRSATIARGIPERKTFGNSACNMEPGEFELWLDDVAVR